MMRRFESTEGPYVWINDTQVVAVVGEKNNVKIITTATGYGHVTQVRGDVRDVAVTLNGYFDD